MSRNFRSFVSQYRIPLLVILVLLVSAGAFLVLRPRLQTGSGGQQIPVDTGVSTGQGGATGIETGEPDVSILLSEGQAQPQTAVPVPLATG